MTKILSATPVVSSLSKRTERQLTNSIWKPNTRTSKSNKATKIGHRTTGNRTALKFGVPMI